MANSGKKIVVPEGMLKAACDAPSAIPGFQTSMERILKAALCWLSENPIVPTNEQVEEQLYRFALPTVNRAQARALMVNWQRRMFLAPEPETPKPLENYISFCPNGHEYGCLTKLQAVACVGNPCQKCGREGKVSHLGVRLVETISSEPEVPEEIEKMLLDETMPCPEFSRPTRQFFNNAVLEAYRRGQRSGK